MRIKIIAPANMKNTGMLSDLKVGDCVEVDPAVADELVEQGLADYDFSNLGGVPAEAPASSPVVDTVVAVEIPPTDAVVEPAPAPVDTATVVADPVV